MPQLKSPNMGQKGKLKRPLAEEDEEDDEIELPQKKRNMEEVEDDDESDDEDEDDSEGDSEEDDDEEDDDDDDEEDDDEEEEDQKATKNQQKPKPPVKQAVTTTSKLESKGHEIINLPNSAAVFVTNLPSHVNEEQFLSFVSDKSGLKGLKCHISYNPVAVLVAESKSQADQLLKSCKGLSYHKHDLHMSHALSGQICKTPKEESVRKNPADLEPTNSFIVYSLTAKVDPEVVKKLCPKATVEKGRQGVYANFDTKEESKEAFLKLAAMRMIGKARIFVKYIRQTNNALHSGSEVTLSIYNVPFETPERDIKELAPKATWFHANPNSPGSYIMEFASTKDCADAGNRLQNYKIKDRALKIYYHPLNHYDLRLNGFNAIPDAKLVFEKLFPEMTDFKILSYQMKKQRKPQFILVFKSRDAWVRAFTKAKNTKTVAGVIVKFPNFSLNPQSAPGEGKKAITAKNAEKKQPAPAQQKKVQVQKVKDEEESEDDEENESGSEMDDDEDSEDQGSDGDESMSDDDDDDSEDGDDDEEEDEDSEEEEKPKPQAKKPQMNNGFQKKPFQQQNGQQQKPGFNKFQQKPGQKPQGGAGGFKQGAGGQKPQFNKKPFGNAQNKGKFNPKFKK